MMQTLSGSVDPPRATENEADAVPAAALAPRAAKASPAPKSGLVKPMLRGVSHQIAFVVALAATAWLVMQCRTRAGAMAALVCGASLVLLFGTSALYHRVDWTPAARQRMRRLDHAAIFMLIGGGYTPLFALVAHPRGGHGALAAIWIAAAVGVVKSLAWPNAPKWLTALVCLVIGWMVIGEVVGRMPIVGATSVGCIFVAGVAFTAGAIAYAAKRPDPWPRVFGYHEIFHLLVVLACSFLFGHVVLVINAIGA